MAEEESPLIKALPPNSDFYTYLTIVEYNLSAETLPILHKVLQDPELTKNIGWDLVHLLMPYLPDSQTCLQDIALSGNPREVILQVTEALRLIEYESSDEPEVEDESAEAGASDVRTRADSSTYPLKTAQVAQSGRTSQAVELPPPLPLPVTQFLCLLPMLSVLHGRIKTKNPSRFLSTSLQAILASFSKSSTHREVMIAGIVNTIKHVGGLVRPPLPTRRSSSMLGPNSQYSEGTAPASDPEAAADSTITPEENALRKRLLQSLVTHVLEEYLLNLPSTKDDVPGMAWSARIMEKLHPDRVIPESVTFAQRFATKEDLQSRLDAIGQIVNVALDLGISDEDLLGSATAVDVISAKDSEDEDDPPESAKDIPLSRLGSMLLYTARQASGVLYGTGRGSRTRPFAIFPDHHDLLKNCLSAPNQGLGTLGTEPEALIDAVIALGLLALEDNAIGEPSDEQFNDYLQTMALLSLNCPSPNLRGHAHYLTTTILRSHPDDQVRLAFIRDTLEHCPFENLKVSAVGWIKGETIEANPPTPIPGLAAGGHIPHHETSIFAKSIALDTLSPFLFPSVQTDLLTSPLRDAWITFRSNLSFYLASINFVYLLLCAKHLHENLMIHDLWTNNDLPGSFVQPLRQAKERFAGEMKGGGELSEERSDEVLAEMNVLGDALERVEGALRFLNE